MSRLRRSNLVESLYRLLESKDIVYLFNNDMDIRTAIFDVSEWAYGQGYGDVRDFGVKGYSTGRNRDEFIGVLRDWVWSWGSSSNKPLPKNIKKLAKVLGITRDINKTLKDAREIRAANSR